MKLNNWVAGAASIFQLAPKTDYRMAVAEAHRQAKARACREAISEEVALDRNFKERRNGQIFGFFSVIASYGILAALATKGIPEEWLTGLALYPLVLLGACEWYLRKNPFN